MGVPLTRRLIEGGLPATKTVLYEATDSFGIESLDEDLRKFMTEVLPIDTSTLLLRRGLVAPIQEFQSSEQLRFPAGVGVQYTAKIQETIMNSAIFGLSLLAETPQDQWPMKPERLEQSAKVYLDKLHPWGLSVLALIVEKDSRIKEAKAHWLSTKEILENDASLAERHRQARLKHIGMQLDRLNSLEEVDGSAGTKVNG